MEQIRFNPYEHDLVNFAKLHRKQPTKAESLFRGIVRIKKCCDINSKEKIQYETLS